MSVGFNTNKDVVNVASTQATNSIQQGNFKGHKVSVSKDAFMEPSAMNSLINFPNKTLFQRKVAVVH